MDSATDSSGGSGSDTDAGTDSGGSSSSGGTSSSAGTTSTSSGGSTSGATSGGSTSGASATTSTSGTGGTGGTTGGTSGGSTGGGSTSGSTTGGSTGGGSTGSTGGLACEPIPDFTEIYWVADAMLSDGMQETNSQSLPGNPLVAYSTVAETGVVTFEVTVPCEDDFSVWALVWDRYEGTQNPSNADSFFYNADGGNEFIFAYGCGTFGLGDAQWSWQQLAALDGNQCPQDAYVQPLTAGTHHLNFRNREQGDFGEQNMAAIAAIVVSNDPNHDPYNDFQP